MGEFKQVGDVRKSRADHIRPVDKISADFRMDVSADLVATLSSKVLENTSKTYKNMKKHGKMGCVLAFHTPGARLSWV